MSSRSGVLIAIKAPVVEILSTRHEYFEPLISRMQVVLKGILSSLRPFFFITITRAFLAIYSK